MCLYVFIYLYVYVITKPDIKIYAYWNYDSWNVNVEFKPFIIVYYWFNFPLNFHKSLFIEVFFVFLKHMTYKISAWMCKYKSTSIQSAMKILFRINRTDKEEKYIVKIIGSSCRKGVDRHYTTLPSKQRRNDTYFRLFLLKISYVYHCSHIFIDWSNNNNNPKDLQEFKYE